MKNLSTRILTLLVMVTLFSASCKKDDAAPATGLSLQNLEGDWTLTSSEGTEWEEGVGIVTPRAPDASLVGYKFVITSTTITVKDISGTTLLGPVSYTLNTTTGVISAGNSATGLGVYTISNFKAGVSMDWDQREPIAEDFEPQAGCGCNLSFQKFFKFAKL